MKLLLIAVITSIFLSFNAFSSELKITPYGFFKGSYLIANQALGNIDGTESNSKPFVTINDKNASALQNEEKSQFSVRQSRFGSTFSKAENSFQIEFDLDGDKTNTNGATASSSGIIRVRQANFQTKMGKGKLTFGKKWSLFKGAIPHTYSTTMIQFFSGNTGFLVDGVDYIYKLGTIDLGVELFNVSDQTTREVSSPVYTFLFTKKFNHQKFGLALTKGTLKHEIQDENNNLNSEASGSKIFYDGKFGNFHVVAEYFTGENLGSIHTGSISKASLTEDCTPGENGYFISMKYNFEPYSIFVGSGQTTFNIHSNAGANNLSENRLLRIGFDKKLDSGILIFSEIQKFESVWNNNTNDDTDLAEGTLIDLGLMWKF